MIEHMFATTDDHEFGTDPAALLQAGLDAVAGEDRDGWTDAALSERLTELLAAADRLRREILRLAGRWDAGRAWEADASLSGAAWLSVHAPVRREDARRMLRTAAMAHRHSKILDEMAADAVSAAHVDVLSRAVGHRRAHLLDDPGHLETLLAAARALPVDHFATVARRWALLADDELAAGDYQDRHLRRGVYLARMLDGWVGISGTIAPEAGAALEAALDRICPPDPREDPAGTRTLPQRRADALGLLAESFLGGGTSPADNDNNNDNKVSHTATRPGPATLLSVVVDAGTLTGLPPATSAPALATVRCDMDGMPVGRDTLRRIACDTVLSRVVMRGPSVVVDVGRSRRLVTSTQRRLLAIRDGGCVVRGCRRPPLWCDVHHVVSWIDGGATDLDNLVMICRRHHTLLHEGRWRLVRRPDGTWTSAPPGQPP